MTREVYDLLTEVLDNLEKELKTTKESSSKDEQTQTANNELHIKIDVNISIH